MAEQNVKNRNNMLDLLKLIAIALVVTGHSLLPYKDVAVASGPILYALTVPTFLMISAYLRTKKMDKTGAKGAYEPRYLFMSYMGLIVAYLIVVVFELIVCYPMYKRAGKLPLGAKIFDSVPVFLKWLFTGTFGFGNYFIPLMLELIVFIPLVYLLFKKNRYIGLAACALINFAYDYLSLSFGMPQEVYKLLILRFTLMLGFGVFLSGQKEFDKKSDIFAAVMLVAGLVYVVINGYIHTFEFYGQEWAGACMFVAPLAYGYMYFVMKHFSNIGDHKVFVFGRASYHIFLTQMVFYFFWGNLLLVAMFGKLPQIIGVPLNIAAAIVITFAIGLGFYKVETKLRKKLGIGH